MKSPAEKLMMKYWIRFSPAFASANKFASNAKLLSNIKI
jgi:hypothetical protein